MYSFVFIEITSPLYANLAIKNKEQNKATKIVSSSKSNSSSSISGNDVYQGKEYVINGTDSNSTSYNELNYFDVNSGEWAYINNNSSGHAVEENGAQFNPSGNLEGGKSANRIIFNVNSKASYLYGTTAIVGSSAQFILINPYVISCNGCSFKNTNGVSLMVGTADYNSGTGLLTVDTGNTISSQNNNALLELTGTITVAGSTKSEIGADLFIYTDTLKTDNSLSLHSRQLVIELGNYSLSVTKENQRTITENEVDESDTSGWGGETGGTMYADSITINTYNNKDLEVKSNLTTIRDKSGGSIDINSSGNLYIDNIRIESFGNSNLSSSGKIAIVNNASISSLAGDISITDFNDFYLDFSSVLSTNSSESGNPSGDIIIRSKENSVSSTIKIEGSIESSSNITIDISFVDSAVDTANLIIGLDTIEAAEENATTIAAKNNINITTNTNNFLIINSKITGVGTTENNNVNINLETTGNNLTINNSDIVGGNNKNINITSQDSIDIISGTNIYSSGDSTSGYNTSVNIVSKDVKIDNSNISGILNIGYINKGIVSRNNSILINNSNLSTSGGKLYSDTITISGSEFVNYKKSLTLDSKNTNISNNSSLTTSGDLNFDSDVSITIDASFLVFSDSGASSNFGNENSNGAVNLKNSSIGTTSDVSAVDINSVNFKSSSVILDNSKIISNSNLAVNVYSNSFVMNNSYINTFGSFYYINNTSGGLFELTGTTEDSASSIAVDSVLLEVENILIDGEYASVKAFTSIHITSKTLKVNEGYIYSVGTLTLNV